jgi:RND family efflux transporter MFP subunit
MTQFIGKWRKQLLVSFVLFPLLLGGGWFLFGGRAGGDAREPWPADEAQDAHDRSAISVTAEPITYRKVERTVEAVGTLHAYEEVSIMAKVEGRVRRIVHEVSDRVKPDELLLEIDPTDSELAVAQAEKSLQVELARLGFSEPPKGNVDLTNIPAVVQARARLENSQQRLERAKKLASTHSISPEEYNDRITDSRAAQSEYDSQMLIARAALATIRMRWEALRTAQNQLRDTKVLVPIPTRPVPGDNGHVEYAVTQRSVAEGTFVRTGTELFRLVIDQSLRLRVNVPERFTNEVALGQKAAVTTAASAEPFEGVVSRINPDVNPTTRTFEVEISVANPNGKRKPGSFAKTAIVTRLDSAATTVPLESIVSFAGITKIFLIVDGQAKEVQVTLGVQGDTWVEIATPELPRDGIVITSGQTAIAEGARVAIRKSEPAKDRKAVSR